MAEENVQIKVIRPFLVAGKRKEAGEVLTVPESDGKMLIHYGKAEAIDKTNKNLQVPVVASQAKLTEEQLLELGKQELAKRKSRLKGLSEKLAGLDLEMLKVQGKAVGLETDKADNADKLREAILKATEIQIRKNEKGTQPKA